MALTFPKRLYKLCRPHFGIQGKKLKRTLALTGLVTGKILYALLASLFNSAINAMIGTLENPLVTYTIFYTSLGPVLGYLFLHVVMDQINSFFTNYLRGSLTEALDHAITKKWFKNNAFYGIHLLNNNNKNIDPAQVMTTDCPDLIATSFRLLDDFLRVGFQFVAGVIGLYLLSWSMIVGSLLYACLYNLITSRVSKPLQKQEEDLKHAEDNLHEKSRYIVNRAESIAFYRGNNFERRGLRSLLNIKRNITEVSNKIRLSLYNIGNLHHEIIYLVPILLSVPDIIAKRLKLGAVWEIVPNFTWIVGLFTWKNDNIEDLTLCNVTLSRVERFQAILDEYQQIFVKHSKITTQIGTSDSSNLTLKNITLYSSDGKALLSNINATLPRGSATLLEGKSGSGKTTLLRAFASLWPYTSPESTVVLPKGADNIHFIPLDAFMYQRGNTLLQVITYPPEDTQKNTPTPCNETITTLMEQFGLQDKITDLETPGIDWKGRLSAGEKQRIVLINAIIKKPPILFMDETTANLDRNNKNIALKILQEKLPNTIILYTDHSPTKSKKTPRRTYIPSQSAMTTPREKTFHSQSINLSEFKP